ncbi:MAG TPA: DUF4235 domain-containing protein [Cellulomonas sp.]
MTEQRNKTLVRLAGVGAGLAAAWLAHRVVDALWRRTMGHATPSADDEDAPLAELAVATALSGALVALTRLLATRGTARAAALLAPGHTGD